MDLKDNTLRNKLKVINKRVSIAESIIKDGLQNGKYVTEHIVYASEKRREARAIHNKLYK